MVQNPNTPSWLHYCFRQLSGLKKLSLWYPVTTGSQFLGQLPDFLSHLTELNSLKITNAGQSIHGLCSSIKELPFPFGANPH